MRDAVIRDILVILGGFTTCLGRVKAGRQARRLKRPDTRDPGRVSIIQMTDSKLWVREFAFLEDQIPWSGFLIFSQCQLQVDRKSTRLNSSHRCISYAVFCLKKKKKI